MVSLFSNNVFLIAVAVIVLLAVVLFVSYVKAPPSNAYIISGLSKEPRVLIGRGGFRIPFFERLDQVYLGQISVDIKTDVSVPTKDFINVDVDAIAKVRVTPTSEGTRLAAKNFLNMTPYQITEQLKESLQGNMREIIGTLEQKKREAEAKKYAMMQEAEGILAKGEAEAKAIEMKGEAEAKAMDKKAEAYKKYNNAAIIQMMVGILPDVAKNVAEPISAIKELKVYSGSGSGENGGGVASVSGIVPVAIKQTFDVVEEATGVNLSEVMKAGTIEARTTRNINIGGKAGEAVEGLVEGLQEGTAQE